MTAIFILVIMPSDFIYINSHNGKRSMFWTLSIFAIATPIAIWFIYQNINEMFPEKIYQLHTLNHTITLRQKETHNWGQYRLGDMFESERQRSMSKGYKLHQEKFPQSIAVKYMNRMSSNYQLMLQIVNEQTLNHPELIPNNHTLVIHLRTGDIIDLNDKYTVDDYLKFRNVTNLQYTRPLSFYDKMFNDIKKQNITFDHVLIITGFHRSNDHKKSISYIEHIVKHIERMGYNVILRINQNPDDDFITMCNSKYFIKSGGGFSRMTANMVRLKGGKVFG